MLSQFPSILMALYQKLLYYINSIRYIFTSYNSSIPTAFINSCFLSIISSITYPFSHSNRKATFLFMIHSFFPHFTCRNALTCQQMQLGIRHGQTSALQMLRERAGKQKLFSAWLAFWMRRGTYLKPSHYSLPATSLVVESFKNGCMIDIHILFLRLWLVRHGWSLFFCHKSFIIYI